jgi:2-haloacid dehalogenase
VPGARAVSAVRSSLRSPSERPVHVSPLEYDAYDVLTFDTYGTLIDWEAGIVAALHGTLGAAADALGDDDLLTCFAGVEHELETPGTRYRDVLATALQLVAAELGTTASAGQAAAFGGSVADWPPFPDSAEALQRLHTRFALATITNCDDDLFAASEKRLGVSFDVVITAQQVGRYKPDPAGFHVAFERIQRELGVPRERILHVAQSLFHDHVTAKRLGMRTVWIDRRAGRAGGATPPAVPVEPDARFVSLRDFAAVAVAS